MKARRGAPARDESFRPETKLRRRADFQQCYRKGRRRNGRFATLYAAPNDRGGPRLGITVGKKVGGAVVRVRIKRRIREIFRRWSERSNLPEADMVLHVRPSAASASFPELAADVRRLMSWLCRSAATR